jgi:hypothetical protein
MTCERISVPNKVGKNSDAALGGAFDAEAVLGDGHRDLPPRRQQPPMNRPIDECPPSRTHSAWN